MCPSEWPSFTLLIRRKFIRLLCFQTSHRAAVETCTQTRLKTKAVTSCKGSTTVFHVTWCRHTMLDDSQSAFWVNFKAYGTGGRSEQVRAVFVLLCFAPHTLQKHSDLEEPPWRLYSTEAERTRNTWKRACYPSATPELHGHKEKNRAWNSQKRKAAEQRAQCRTSVT